MSVKAYPCIGGPLDGKHAVTSDFYSAMRRFSNGAMSILVSDDTVLPSEFVPAGMYAHLSDQYFRYNSAGRYRQGASMVFIHVSLLQQSIKPKDR